MEDLIMKTVTQTITQTITPAPALNIVIFPKVGATQKVQSTNAWSGETVARMVGSKGNSVYDIKRGRKGLTCACMAFRFKKGEIGSPGKTCKHIEAAKKSCGGGYIVGLVVMEPRAFLGV
jgi:hypothetical protein